MILLNEIMNENGTLIYGVSFYTTSKNLLVITIAKPTEGISFVNLIMTSNGQEIPYSSYISKR